MSGIISLRIGAITTRGAKMSREKMWAVGSALLVAVLAIWVAVLSVGLAYERGHNSGYNEGWNDGRADGIEQGWQGCIEENNLYERYYYGE